MRIDKFLSQTGTASRKETASAAKAGQILVDGKVCRCADFHIDPEKNTVQFRGAQIIYRKYTYIMLNKPDGYVSATEDTKERTVMELLPPQLQKIGLFPCGRLDKNTLGLLILTNNGQLAHMLLSPRRHVSKTYRFALSTPITAQDVVRLDSGIELEDGYVTKPARTELEADMQSGTITITEGKFHQVKRMFEAVGSKIVYLERTVFASIPLDVSLRRGEWRYLDNGEISVLEEHIVQS